MFPKKELIIFYQDNHLYFNTIINLSLPDRGAFSFISGISIRIYLVLIRKKDKILVDFFFHISKTYLKHFNDDRRGKSLLY
jgi:hypothetical protein